MKRSRLSNAAEAYEIISGSDMHFIDITQPSIREAIIQQRGSILTYYDSNIYQEKWLSDVALISYPFGLGIDTILTTGAISFLLFFLKISALQKLVVVNFSDASFCLIFDGLGVKSAHSQSLTLLLFDHAFEDGNWSLLSYQLTLRLYVNTNHFPPISQNLILFHELKGILLLLLDHILQTLYLLS